MTDFWDAFQGLGVQARSALDSKHYLVSQTQFASHLVGTDRSGRACVLVETLPPPSGRPVSYELRGVQAFYAPATQILLGEDLRTADCVLVRCTEEGAEAQRYFLSVWQVLAQIVGEQPSFEAVMAGVDRLVSLFAKPSHASAESIVGLVGELVFLNAQMDVPEAVRAWHHNSMGHFDFVFSDCRVEVKTTVTSQRRHVFSYEQTDYSGGTPTYIASVLLDEADTGTSVNDLIADVVAKCAHEPELQLKVWSQVSDVVGVVSATDLERSVNLPSSLESVRFYLLSSVPAVRGPLPPGVSSVHFSADLAFADPVVSPVAMAANGED